MSNFLSRYNTDANLEENGVWVDFGDGIEVMVVRTNSKEAQKLKAKLERPYRKLSQVPDDVQEAIYEKMIAQAVIKDWKGVTDAKGKEIPYSGEAALEILKKFKDFRDDIIMAASELETFRQIEMEQQEKN